METPVKCNEYDALNYRSHPLSLFALVIVCGMTDVLIVTLIYTDFDLAFGKTTIAFGIAAALYVAECFLLPLKTMELAYKKR